MPALRVLTALCAIAVVVALLPSACSGAPTRGAAVAERAAQLRDALASAVPDAKRRAALDVHIAALEKSADEAVGEIEKFNRAFTDASANPDTPPVALDKIARDLAAVRRVRLSRMMETRLALRSEMTPDEWRAFAGALTTFDKG